MNFQGIPSIESEKVLLDLAFRKAREKGIEKNLKGNWLEIIRKKEGLKIDIVKETLVTKLEKIQHSFIHPKQLSDFYIKLMKLTIDFDEYKKSLAALGWAAGKVRFFQSEYVKKIFNATDKGRINELSRQFYGRIASIIKQINGNLRFLEEARRIFRTYPDIKEMFTVCIYGFPNVGKSTLLNRLTGTKAETAAYAFTTKSINAGYLKFGEKKVQILDVPGTLARGERMNLIEAQADLVMKELANLIIFVFDLSGYSGYPIRKQEQLYHHLEDEMKKSRIDDVQAKLSKREVLLYLSKLDLTPSDVLEKFKLRYYSVEELRERIKEEFKL